MTHKLAAMISLHNAPLNILSHWADPDFDKLKCQLWHKKICQHPKGSGGSISKLPGANTHLILFLCSMLIIKNPPSETYCINISKPQTPKGMTKMLEVFACL